MYQKLLVALMMAGLTAIASAETVYKWVDGRGQVHYTDLPPRQPDARVLGVFHDTAALEEEMSDEEDTGDEAGDDGDGSPPAGNEPEQDSISRAEIAAVNAEVASTRNKQCKEAQDRYQRYLESRRLFKEGADGKRVYLTDQELAEARVRAKKAVDESCG